MVLGLALVHLISNTTRTQKRAVCASYRVLETTLRCQEGPWEYVGDGIGLLALVLRKNAHNCPHLPTFAHCGQTKIHWVSGQWAKQKVTSPPTKRRWRKKKRMVLRNNGTRKVFRSKKGRGPRIGGITRVATTNN